LITETAGQGSASSTSRPPAAQGWQIMILDPGELDELDDDLVRDMTEV
jgi:hypothetical protein